MKFRRIASLAAATLLVLGLVVSATSANAGAGVSTRYLVVLKATQDKNGNYQIGGNYAAYHDAAVAAVKSAGGTIAYDLSKQIGVIIADSTSTAFVSGVQRSSLVDVVSEDFKWKAFPTMEEAVATGQLTVASNPSLPGGPQPHSDVLEPLQWNMQLIRAPQAHAAVQAGSPAVQVGILDSGFDATHADLAPNADCSKGADFIPLGPSPLTIGTPCNDNQFHGTHVAGIVAAKANGTGVVGVAPNVTIIPVKVCDTAGYCYSSSSAAAITYAGDQKFEVINMSYFVDDDQLLGSTEFKCMSDPVQKTFRMANERAIQYARNQGVLPVAALGNSDNDLAHPPEPYENDCDVVPAETQGVIGTMAVGPSSEKAFYSNYGNFATDVAAPGGNSENPRGELPGPCFSEVFSTIPGNQFGCFQGTSMASPHTTGVAALIVSQFGRLGTDAGQPDVVMRPTEVENYLQSTTIDLIWLDANGKTAGQGYDRCFGNGRIDALRAVQHDTSRKVEQLTIPPEASGCPAIGE